MNLYVFDPKCQVVKVYNQTKKAKNVPNLTNQIFVNEIIAAKKSGLTPTQFGVYMGKKYKRSAMWMSIKFYTLRQRIKKEWENAKTIRKSKLGKVLQLIDLQAVPTQKVEQKPQDCISILLSIVK